MSLQIDTVWLLSVAFCIWLGYRLGEHYQIKPSAGVAFGLAVNLLLAIDFSLIELGSTQTSSRVQFLALYVAALAVFLSALLAGKQKLLALAKLSLVLAVVALAFDFVPRQEPQGARYNAAVPEGVVAETINRARLPHQIISAMRSSKLGFRTIARIKVNTPLYYGIFRTPEDSGRLVAGGVWVTVRRTVLDDQGNRWAEVLLPNREGEYSEDPPTEIGFVPAAVLSFHIPVPALT